MWILLGTWFYLNVLTSHAEGQVTGDLRVIDGPSPHEGRVEIYYSGDWGSICDDDWDDTDAKVVCKQLGYDKGNAVDGGTYGPAWSHKIVMDEVTCTGSETKLVDCAFDGWLQNDCDHYEDAGVKCLREGILRLQDGYSPEVGRIEVYHLDNWSTICDDEWDNDDATVACREFGYKKGWSRDGGHFDAGTGAIAMDEINCVGTESSLISCPFDGWMTHDCDATEHAGVLCGNGKANGDIRLMGGRKPHEGRLEVSYNEFFRPVCDDDWDDKEAFVVCRELGYKTGRAKQGQTFPAGIGEIVIDDVACNGTEKRLVNCAHDGWESHNCDASDESAGVICQPFEEFVEFEEVQLDIAGLQRQDVNLTFCRVSSCALQCRYSMDCWGFMFTEDACLCSFIVDDEKDPIKDLNDDPAGVFLYRPKPSSTANDYEYEYDY